MLPAYIDPTQGGLLTQIVFGAFAAVALFLKLTWRRIASLFGGSKSAVPADPPKSEPPKSP